MQILQQPISREELRTLAQNTFGDMIKCVADVQKGLLAGQSFKGCGES